MNFPILVFDPEASYVEGRDVFMLVVDYTYEWEKDGRRYRITVPKGYLTDKASVPQFAWSLGFKPDGAPEGAAVLHDFLYQHKGELPAGSYQTFIDGSWQNIPNVWTRAEIDRLFGRIMREHGVGPVKRKLMYYSVRLFGWWAYHHGM